MGKYADYIKRAYNVNYASFIPNYYKLFYKESAKENYCTACNEFIEPHSTYIIQWNRTGSYFTTELYLCKECGEECAKIHDMEIQELDYGERIMKKWKAR